MQQPTAHPLLIAMKGHPGTGKSTLAQALAHRLGLPLLDKDDVKDHTLHLPEGNTLAYAITWQIVETQLRLGLSVVADTPLSYPEDFAAVLALVARRQATWLVVETQLAEAEWRQRLDGRTPADSTHKVRGWAAMQELLVRYNGCWRFPIDPAHHLVIDTALPLAGQVALVIRRVEAELAAVWRAPVVAESPDTERTTA